MRLRLLAFLLMLVGAGAAHAGCTTGSTTMTFTPSSSYDVQAGTIAQVSGSAGLTCTGSTLSLLGSSYAKATVTSANGFRLASGGGDTLPYQASADAAGTQAFTQGKTIDYTNSSLVALLGGNAGNFTASLFTKLTAAPNVAAGTYSDTLTVNWDYKICSGIQIAGVCVGYEQATVVTTVTITLVVGKDCRISAPNVSFGTAALVSQFTPVSQAVLVDCTKGSTYFVSFSNGSAGSARPWRAMKNSAGDSLQYNIYRSDGATIWDESNKLAGTAAGTGGTTPTQIQSYVAKVNPSQPTPPVGSYADTVSVIITF